MKAAALLLCAVLLSACLSAKERAERLAADDDAQCKSYGLAFGTPAYADCRLRLHEGRQRAEAAVSAAPDNQLRVANAIAV
jgi:hypothetical protein